MCGIAGYHRLSRDSDVSIDLAEMTRLLTHRGPDSEGFLCHPEVGLGIRRLSVIDLETGDQPIANETGDVQVVYNGEIYNFRELRSRLRSRGHHFLTASDTEILAHGWEEWGEELPRKLRGMFAFAIWDRRRRKLFLARDHFGVKPLYYAQTEDLLLFASEIKSLLILPQVSREMDPEALDQYLSFLYIPEPRTIFRAVRALPPAHTLTSCDGEVSLARYWRFEPRPGRFSSPREAIAEVREVFRDSVRAMRVADVPLGLFLSGGVDSASILAMMAEGGDEPVRTFSIGFGRAERRWDELAEARRLAEAFGAEHREFRIEPDVVSQLPGVIRHFDQPFANPTAVLLNLLSRETRRHVKVALAGTGGDELFGGYPRYLGMSLYQRYRWLPVSLRRLAAELGRRVLRDATDGRTGAERLRRFLAGGALPFEECYLRMLVPLEETRQRALYSPRQLQALGGFDATSFLRDRLRTAAGRSQGSAIDRLLAADVATYLPFNQLVYSDRMSMAQSLEVRVPFVDQRLAEAAASIPLAWNLRRGATKGLFRDAMSPYLPRHVLAGRKRGLNLPISLWFRGRLRSWMEELLSPRRIEQRGYFRSGQIGRLIDEHLAGRRNHALVLWALVVLELWHQAYVDDPDSVRRAPEVA